MFQVKALRNIEALDRHGNVEKYFCYFLNNVLEKKHLSDDAMTRFMPYICTRGSLREKC